MTTVHIGDRLAPYFVAEAGCRFHDRYWIGCNYCAENRAKRDGLASERRHVATVAALLREEYAHRVDTWPGA